MLEKYLIPTHGFRNVVQHGQITGFEIDIRIAYYRGISLNIIRRIELAVDGAPVPHEAITVRAGTACVPLARIGEAETVRWEFDQPLTLCVDRPGGLPAGAHRIALKETIKPAYMPADGFSSSVERSVTICPPGGAGAAHPITLGVSLYSYQEEYYTHAMTLEDCIAEVAQTGATGIQLIPEQMMPGYPTPSPALVDRWHAAVARHGLTPTLMDTFVDVSCGGHRTLSLEEGVQQLVEQMRLAKQLGFSIIRPTTGPVIESAPELIRAALPYAEELDVRIAPEIHAPIPLDGPYIDSYLELIAKSGTRHLGFTLDLGVFCKRIPPAAIAMVLRKGGQPEIIAYLERAFAEKLSGDAARAGMQAMHPNDVTRDFGFHYGAFGPSTNQVAHLPRIIPHIMNVHGKFYEVTESGVEESIDTIDVVAALASGGYTGSIDSEYEGQRLTQDAFPTDSCEQVRRHQLLLRRGLQAVS